MGALLGNLFGTVFKFVYDLVSGIGTEPASISYYAITIILVTILFKVALLPLALHQNKSTRKMSEIQPKMQEIQKKYKDDPQTQQAKMMALYKEHNYNPMAGCLPLLIQLPIILAFFSMLRDPVKYVFKDPSVYAAIAKNFLWIQNLELADTIMWGLPLVAALTTFVQSKVMMANTPSDPQTASTQKMMNLMLPLMIFWSAKSFPAGLALYWVVSNLFQIGQSLLTNMSIKKDKEAN